MVEPLKSRTMTLPKLQLATLDLIRKMKFQLRRMPHEEGMNDEEFIDGVLTPFENTIYADRHVRDIGRRHHRRAEAVEGGREEQEGNRVMTPERFEELKRMVRDGQYHRPAVEYESELARLLALVERLTAERDELKQAITDADDRADGDSWSDMDVCG